VGIVVISITYLSLVIGELVPKRLALANPERIAAVLAPGMRTLSRLASPLVRVLSLSTDLLIRVLGIRLPGDSPVTEEEINLMIAQGARVGMFEPSEQEMVERIFRLADLPIGALMTPRREVIWLDLDEPADDVESTVVLSGHSHFPVARDGLDNVQGMVQAKDLLAQSLKDQAVDLQAVVRPALFVPETMSALELLERLREERAQVAFVIDEFGGFQGLVTISDLLGAIVGDVVQSEAALEPEAVLRPDGSWLLDGRVLIDELKDLLELDALPDEESGNYQTLGGMVMSYLGRIPTSGDSFHWRGWQFEVVDMDGHRVDKLLATPAR
jgi:putative hemolysin